MALHAKLSASKTKEWKNAPGIIALHERFPLPNVSGEAAQMGTCVHDLIERCLAKGEEPSQYLGRIAVLVNPDTPQEGVSILRPNAKTPKVGTVWFELDEELIEAATCMTDYVRGRLDAMLDEKMTTDEAVHRDALQLERRTNPLPDRDDTGGTADVTMVYLDEDFGEIELVDYKNGTGVFVPVEGNPQLLSYLLGQALSILGGISDDYSYRMTIVQPRHHLTPDDGVMSVVVTADELREFELELRAAVELVDRGREVLDELFLSRNDATFEDCVRALDDERLLEVKGFGTDKIWDPYLKDVPSNRRLAEEVLEADFADDPPDEVRKVEMPADLARILAWAPAIQAQIKHAEETAERVLREGGEVPGRKLVRKKGNRAWRPEVKQEAKTAREIAKAYGVDEAKLLNDPKPATLRTGPQVLASIPKDKKEDFEEKYIYQPRGDVIMVDESDKRAAFKPMQGASDDFDDDL